MRFAFKNKKLEKVYSDEIAAHKLSYPPEVMSHFFSVLDIFASVEDVNELRKFKGLRLEKLKGKRSHQYSVRLNKQWRLLIEFQQDIQGKIIIVIDIIDYH